MEPSVGDDQRRAEVLTEINGIVDPCSEALRVPVGITDLGLVEALDLDGGRVRIELVMTAPFCMFAGLFEEEVKRRVSILPWVDSVHVEMKYDRIWDESRMAESARVQLHERYRRPARPSSLRPMRSSSAASPTT